MNLLTFTTLYPDSARARHGIFVETRLRHLVATGEVQAVVVAPVPWFPFRHPGFGAYSTYARIAREEWRHGIRVLHPRYLLLPRIGMTSAPFFLAWSGYRTIRRLRREGYCFDAIDAHYFYPDGVAAAILGRWLKKPVVITARGTDVNLIPQYRLPRTMILWAAKCAVRIVTVCEALRKALTDLGVASKKVETLRNGVDLKRFAPVDRTCARSALGLTRTTLISVGHLIERKGHHIVIEALAGLPGMELIVVGDGEDEHRLRALAARLGVADRTRFIGAVPQEQLRQYYGAADILVLASSREGWANVLLEAMACGTPVVATAIWGTPEVVTEPVAGVLMRERTAAALIEAVRSLLSAYPDHDAVRRYAERFGWESTTRGQLELFRGVIGPLDDGHTRDRPAIGGVDTRPDDGG